jgi:hypothetical protein
VTTAGRRRCWTGSKRRACAFRPRAVRRSRPRVSAASRPGARSIRRRWKRPSVGSTPLSVTESSTTQSSTTATPRGSIRQRRTGGSPYCPLLGLSRPPRYSLHPSRSGGGVVKLLPSCTPPTLQAFRMRHG